MQIKSNIRSVYQCFHCAFHAILQEMPTLEKDQVIPILERLVRGQKIPDNSLMSIAAGLYWHQEPNRLLDLFETPEPLLVAQTIALGCNHQLVPRSLIAHLCATIPPQQESLARTLQATHSLVEQGQTGKFAYSRLRHSPLAFGFYCFLTVPWMTTWAMLLMKKYIPPEERSSFMSIHAIGAVHNLDVPAANTAFSSLPQELGDWLYRQWIGSSTSTLPIVTSADFLRRRI